MGEEPGTGALTRSTWIRGAGVAGRAVQLVLTAFGVVAIYEGARHNQDLWGWGLFAALVVVASLTIEVVKLRRQRVLEVHATGQGLPRWRLSVKPDPGAPTRSLLLFLRYTGTQVVIDALTCHVEAPSGTCVDFTPPKPHGINPDGLLSLTRYPDEFASAGSLEPGEYTIDWTAEVHGVNSAQVLASGVFTVTETVVGSGQ